jgi:hypothetical protein
MARISAVALSPSPSLYVAVILIALASFGTENYQDRKSIK